MTDSLSIVFSSYIDPATGYTMSGTLTFERTTDISHAQGGNLYGSIVCNDSYFDASSLGLTADMFQ